MFQTSATKRNPYQPTTSTSVSGVDIPPLLPEELANHEILFDGSADEDDLEELLNLTSTTGRNWLLLFPIIFGALIVLMNASWPWVMCAVGLALFFLVLVSLLSRSFRRATFLAYNPRWDQNSRGSIDQSGYESRCGGASSLVLWSYHCNAYHSESIVAFQSAAQPQAYRIFPRSAIGPEEQWELLRAIAARVHCTEQQTQISAARAIRTRSLMTNKDRVRLRKVPQDAIPFAGPITHRDLLRVDTPVTQQRLAKRSYWYAGLATLGLSAIVAGLAGFVLRGAGRDVGPTPTFSVVTVVVVLAGLTWMWTQRRGRVTSNQVYVELIGFVNQVGITFDYPFAARVMPWAGLLIVELEDDRIVLSDAQFDETVLLRSDMFQATVQWKHCCELASEHTLVTGVVIDE